MNKYRKTVYAVLVEHVDNGNYPYVAKLGGNNNVASQIGKAHTVHICATKAAACELCAEWRNSYIANGTISDLLNPAKKPF